MSHRFRDGSDFDRDKLALSIENPHRIQMKAPVVIARIQKASDLMRSIQAPQTTAATVQENGKNACSDASQKALSHSGCLKPKKGTSLLGPSQPVA